MILYAGREMFKPRVCSKGICMYLYIHVLSLSLSAYSYSLTNYLELPLSYCYCQSYEIIFLYFLHILTHISILGIWWTRRQLTRLMQQRTEIIHRYQLQVSHMYDLLTHLVSQSVHKLKALLSPPSDTYNIEIVINNTLSFYLSIFKYLHGWTTCAWCHVKR